MAEEGFAPVIKAIAKWDKTVRADLRKELRAGGEMIAAGARLLAGAHSKKTPGTIKVRTRISSREAIVIVKAGAPDVPIAGLLEEGNKGRRNKKTFRHPVFAHKGGRGGKYKGRLGRTPRDSAAWVEQPMHPYLAPTVKLRQAAVTKRLEKAVQHSIEAVKLG